LTGGVTTKEVARGVFLSLQHPEGGGPGFELRRVRFAKQMFSAEEAEHWWSTHRQAVLQRYSLLGSTSSMEEVDEDGQRAAAAPAAADSTNRPAEGSAAEAAAAAAAADGPSSSSGGVGGGGGAGGILGDGYGDAEAPPRLKVVRLVRRFSAGSAPGGLSPHGHRPPPPGTPTTPALSSPACSTHDVDPFRPPATSPAYAAAAAARAAARGGGGAGDGEVGVERGREQLGCTPPSPLAAAAAAAHGTQHDEGGTSSPFAPCEAGTSSTSDANKGLVSRLIRTLSAAGQQQQRPQLPSSGG